MADSTPPATPLQRAFEALAALGLVACVLPLAVFWKQLPDIVPVHFGFDGQPDSGGGRGTFVFVAALGVIFYAWFTFLPRIALKLEKDPRKKTPLMVARLGTLLAGIKAFSTLIIAWTLWGAIQVSLGRADGLGTWVVPVIFAFVVILVVVAIRWARNPRSRTT